MEAALTLDTDDRDLIRALIIADPNLVLGDDEVMRRLIGQGGSGRRVVDLRDRLVERLESRLAALSETHRSVVAAAYENVAGTQQIHKAVLALIEPLDLSSFLARLVGGLPGYLAIEEVRLCLETDVSETGPASFAEDLDARVLALPEGTVAAYLDGDGPGVVLRAATDQAEVIFGEANPVRSEALIPLDIGGSPGLLALGSGDLATFEASKGTDLLAFLGDVVERLLVQRLADPEL